MRPSEGDLTRLLYVTGSLPEKQRVSALLQFSAYNLSRLTREELADVRYGFHQQYAEQCKNPASPESEILDLIDGHTVLREIRDHILIGDR